MKSRAAALRLRVIMSTYERGTSMLKGLQWLSLVMCCVLGLIITCVLAVRTWDQVNVVERVQAQDSPSSQSKFVEIEPDIPIEAVRVVKITVGGQAVTPGFFNPRKGPSGAPFQAGDDWLKEMKFTVKNGSLKTLVQLTWSVYFPEAAATGYPVAQQVQLGRIPENVFLAIGGRQGDNQGGRQPLDFRPGQEMVMSLAPYADDLRRRIEQHQAFSSVHICYINVGSGFFPDGMHWLLSKYEVLDPSHPGSFKDIDPSEFPVEKTAWASAPY